MNALQKPDECVMCYRHISEGTVQPYPEGNLCRRCIDGGVRFSKDRFRVTR